MAKKDKPVSQGEHDTNDRWEREPSKSFDRFCPKCGVYYPADSTAHEGH